MAPWTQALFLFVFVSCCAACFGEELEPDPDGGRCEYEYYPGICTGTADNTFTFETTTGDETVIYAGNFLSEAETLAQGESVPCTLDWMTYGACQPCMFDIGECGPEAWADPPSR